jgi:SNF2 family DNA or RNA helicase
VPELPDLLHAPRQEAPSVLDYASALIKLQPGMNFQVARAVPGAFYDPAQPWTDENGRQRRGCMVLPFPTPRAAIVALTLAPGLANEYPELEALRDQLLIDVRPTDYASKLGLHIDAPHVHKWLTDQGLDWLEFEDGATQDTDLGYAAAMLEKIHAFYLGWARGYGKTLGTAAIIEARGYNRVLVAAPNSTKVDTWVQQLVPLLPGYTIKVMPNEKQKRADLIEWLKAGAKAGTLPRKLVLIAHHESLKLVAEYGTKTNAKTYHGWAWVGIDWDLLAIDEGHRFANPDTKMHRAARHIPRANTLILSGSVYQNNWEEVFGPLNLMLPDVYATKWDDWNLRNFDYVDGYGKQKIFAGFLEGQDQRLRDELGVFMVVREKPDRSIKQEIKVELTPAQRTAYDSLRDQFFAMLDDDTLVVADAGVVMLTKLREIATGLDLVSREVHDSSKLDEAERIISEYGDFDDFFVAVWYKQSAYALAERLKAHGYHHVFVVTGDVPSGKRRDAVLREAREAAAQDRFNDPVILIGTIGTLGESVNLQYLNHLIRIDRAYNPAKNRQTVDRLDRTGQTREVRATDIIAANTVDELQVMPLLANKDALRAMLLGRTT